MGKKDIFLSFSGIYRTQVKELIVALRRNNFTVFYDKEEEFWGDNLSSKFAEAIRNCRAFIPFFSPDYLSRYWPKYEMELAISLKIKSNLLFLPILIDGGNLPFTLPDDICWKVWEQSTPDELAQSCIIRLSTLPNNYYTEISKSKEDKNARNNWGLCTYFLTSFAPIPNTCLKCGGHVRRINITLFGFEPPTGLCEHCGTFYC